MRLRLLPAFAAGLCLAGLPAAAPAADHLDSPSVEADGRLDINDIYAFQSPTDAANTVLVMTVNPGAGVISGTDLNPSGAYDLMIDNNGDALPDVTYTFLFGAARGSRPQSMLLLRNGRRVARGRTGSTASVSGGGQVLVDLFEDPFFFDLTGFENGLNFTGDDFFAGLNVTAMVLEVPSSELTSDGDPNVGVFARTTIGGEQFDRMGRPGINTVLIPDGLKDAFNDGVPVNDPENFFEPISNTIEMLSGDAAYADMIAAVLTPDILTFDTSSSAGFLNGRRLQDDVIDIELDLLSMGAITSDGVDSNDAAFPGTFPYLAPPN